MSPLCSWLIVSFTTHTCFLGQPSSVYDQMRAGDPRRHPTGQKKYRICHILRSADARDRTVGGFPQEGCRFLAELIAFAFQHRSIDVAGTDAIHADIVLAVVDSHGSGEVENTGLGRTVGRGLRASFQGPSGAGVD